MKPREFLSDLVEHTQKVVCNLGNYYETDIKFLINVFGGTVTVCQGFFPEISFVNMILANVEHQKLGKRNSVQVKRSKQ